MPETALINTLTELTVTGSSISIKTFYDEDLLPDTILASIPDSVGIQDGIVYSEGDLLIQMKNHPEQIDYYIDGSGNLILLTSEGDASNYSINANGELIYTTEE